MTFEEAVRALMRESEFSAEEIGERLFRLYEGALADGRTTIPEILVDPNCASGIEDVLLVPRGTILSRMKAVA